MKKMIAICYGEYIVVDRPPSPFYSGSLGECEYIIEENPLLVLQALIRARDQHVDYLAYINSVDHPRIRIPLYIKAETEDEIEKYQHYIESLTAAILQTSEDQ